MLLPRLVIGTSVQLRCDGAQYTYGTVQPGKVFSILTTEILGPVEVRYDDQVADGTLRACEYSIAGVCHG